MSTRKFGLGALVEVHASGYMFGQLHVFEVVQLLPEQNGQHHCCLKSRLDGHMRRMHESELHLAGGDGAPAFAELTSVEADPKLLGHLVVAAMRTTPSALTVPELAALVFGPAPEHRHATPAQLATHRALRQLRRVGTVASVGAPAAEMQWRWSLTRASLPTGSALDDRVPIPAAAQARCQEANADLSLNAASAPPRHGAVASERGRLAPLHRDYESLAGSG